MIDKQPIREFLRAINNLTDKVSVLEDKVDGLISRETQRGDY